MSDIPWWIWLYSVVLSLAVTSPLWLLRVLYTKRREAEAEREALLRVVRAGIDCANDLEEELNHLYMSEDGKVHPAFSYRYERDMTTVKTFRAALDALPKRLLAETEKRHEVPQ